MRLAVLMPRLGVPVDPDAGTARRWAEEELSKAAYDDSPSLWERILGWLGDLFEALSRIGGQAPSAVVPMILVVAVLAVVGAALLLGGRARRRRTVDARRVGSLFEDARGSADLTDAADAAARRGDWATAVLERFRAIIRHLDERAVLDDRPGLTAHEAAGLAATALPALAADLDGAGRLFDDVRYGHRVPAADDDAALRLLAQRVGQSLRAAA
ncbi:DUF4129 domain-containing protein [Georgenia sp. AZ-5]|uniref:DUF4129 domain-containing protein n=1 Tax=Georgenia sp. AZ-5 TaxID=3367526 RepID=UPI0037550E27